MSLRNILAFLAAAQAVAADSSHPMHFRKVDAHTAKGVAAYKNVALDGDGSLFNEQVRRRYAESKIWSSAIANSY